MKLHALPLHLAREVRPSICASTPVRSFMYPHTHSCIPTHIFVSLHTFLYQCTYFCIPTHIPVSPHRCPSWHPRLRPLAQTPSRQLPYLAQNLKYVVVYVSTCASTCVCMHVHTYSTCMYIHMYVHCVHDVYLMIRM